ncbi:MAG: hypothetical protein ABSH50_29410 [Bryobacteraceae bacterium]|jgi:hypothetical protein
MTDLSGYIYERDRAEFALGDTLDIKTGLILASLTFLAIQSGALISPTLTLTQAMAQIVSIASLLLGGVLSAIELWPRDYIRETAPDGYDAWISELTEFYGDSEDVEPKIERQVANARLSKAKERITFNAKVNRQKTRIMSWAFYCTVVAFLCNVATLSMRLF